MAGDGLKVFFGEFGILPVPLELSGNWCSHSCSYCFVNAAVPQRQLDLKSVMSLLSNMDKRTGLDARLLRMRYPVNISNHIDPFSESNHKHMIPIMELMTGLDIPIYFQTRGGNEGAIAKTLDFIKPSAFYVSIRHRAERLLSSQQKMLQKLGSHYKRLDLGHSHRQTNRSWQRKFLSIAQEPYHLSH